MHAWKDGRAGPTGFPLSVTVRDARHGDEPQMQMLWRELMDLHVEIDPRFALAEDSEQAFSAYLETARDRDDYRVRLAEVDGEIVGFSVSCILPNSPVYRARWIGYINDLCVTARMRGRGIGEILAKDAIRWLRDGGADSVEVYVARLNAGAQRFWRRIGGRDYLDRLSIEPSDD